MGIALPPQAGSQQSTARRKIMERVLNTGSQDRIQDNHSPL
jgi:hypothetical protein